MTARKYCMVCNKGGIMMLCDRCEQTFCGKHVIEHQQQSASQLDDLAHVHNLIQQELRQSSNRHSLLQTIDKWEKESMIKIQTAAETARLELREMIENSKERLSSACHDILENVHSARQTGQFCENDLTQSMKQLKLLQTKIATPLSVSLVENKNSAIPLITIQGSDFMNKEFEKTKIYSISKSVPTSNIQERFSKVTGPVTINEEGLLARHHGQNSQFGYILGEQLYSKGRHTVRFKIEQSQLPYNIFFGCLSSQMNLNQVHYDSPGVAGWFGYNKVHQHGVTITNVQMHGYDSSKIERYDVVSLIVDCDQRQIELYPERTKKIHELSVNTDKAPFPWQLLVVLTYANDCVRILYAA